MKKKIKDMSDLYWEIVNLFKKKGYVYEKTQGFSGRKYYLLRTDPSGIPESIDAENCIDLRYEDGTIEIKQIWIDKGDAKLEIQILISKNSFCIDIYNLVQENGTHQSKQHCTIKYDKKEIEYICNSHYETFWSIKLYNLVKPFIEDYFKIELKAITDYDLSKCLYNTI